jgi:hypothetical protein
VVLSKRGSSNSVKTTIPVFTGMTDIVLIRFPWIVRSYSGQQMSSLIESASKAVLLSCFLRYLICLSGEKWNFSFLKLRAILFKNNGLWTPYLIFICLQ